MNPRVATVCAFLPLAGILIHVNVTIRSAPARDRQIVREGVLRHAQQRPQLRWGESLLVGGTNARLPGFSAYPVFPHPAEYAYEALRKDRENDMIFEVAARARGAVERSLQSVADPEHRMTVLKLVVLVPLRSDSSRPLVVPGEAWLTTGSLSYHVKGQTGETRIVRWQTEQHWSALMNRCEVSRISVEPTDNPLSPRSAGTAGTAVTLKDSR